MPGSVPQMHRSASPRRPGLLAILQSRGAKC
jgi:hypothetical protein